MSLSRKEKILKLIVEDFIQTAQPVGSHYLLNKYNLNISSATIRNEMNQLEKDGLLEKTHTSSGRIPSTEGYKYYIEHLRDKSVDEKVKNELKTIFESSSSVEDILGKSCEVLSNMTNLASAVLGPGATEERLVSVQIVPLSNNTCTAIFVTDKGYVENKTFVLNEDTNVQDMKKCMEVLNNRLNGTKINELVEKLEAIKPVLSDYMTNYAYVYNVLLNTFYEFSKGRSEFYGKENLFNQPEFESDADSLRKLFDLFENPEYLSEMLEKHNSDFLIGDFDNEYDDVSVISHTISIDGSDIGKIAIVGPRRMDYAKVMNNLDYVAQQIMEHLSKQGIKDEVSDDEKEWRKRRK